MKKSHILILLTLLFLIAGYYYFSSIKAIAPGPEIIVEDALSPKNATYIVEGQSFTLTRGEVEENVSPDSAIVNKLTIFGEPVFGDIDGDGDNDAVLILVNDPGGSGSFFYVALAINVDGVYRGTDTILLGDRIAPQTYRIINDRAEVNYVVRKPEDNFTVSPSVGKTLYLKYDPETFQLIEIASDFAGEANPSVMKLEMQSWTWLKTVFADGTEITPKKPKAFKLTFKKDGTMFATTDCNSISGSYKTKDKSIIFGALAMTEMYCVDSQEQDFAKLLADIQSYTFTSKGELIFSLKENKGTATFR